MASIWYETNEGYLNKKIIEVFKRLKKNEGQLSLEKFKDHQKKYMKQTLRF